MTRYLTEQRDLIAAFEAETRARTWTPEQLRRRRIAVAIAREQMERYSSTTGSAVQRH